MGVGVWITEWRYAFLETDTDDEEKAIAMATDWYNSHDQLLPDDCWDDYDFQTVIDKESQERLCDTLSISPTLLQSKR